MLVKLAAEYEGRELSFKREIADDEVGVQVGNDQICALYAFPCSFRAGLFASRAASAINFITEDDVFAFCFDRRNVRLFE